MSNALIAFGNVADGCTLTGGSWLAAFPLANLQVRQISKAARSTNALAASTTFTAALAASTFIGALSLEGTNASVNAQVRWRMYSDAALTVLVYDSGLVDVYPINTLGFGSIRWGAPNWWTGRPLTSDIARFQRGVRQIVAPRLSAQYIKCEVFDTANPDGYFQAGRLFVGNSFQPKTNMSYGAGLQIKSLSTITRSVSGTKFFTTRRPNFVFPFEFGYLAEAEALRLLDLQAQVDITGEVLFVWDPSDVSYRFRKSVFGELAQLDPLQYPHAAYRSMAFQIEGVL